MPAQKIIHSIKILLLILVLGLANLSSAFADDRYDDIPSAEKFKIRIGSFLIDSFDTTVRFDSADVPLGSLIDLEDNLNVDSSESALRIDGFYRFNKQHRIDWTYYQSQRNGSAITTQDLVIGDSENPEGGFTIPQGSNVQTVWNFDLLKVGYAWSFLNKNRYEMFIGAGLNIRKLDIAIDYQTVSNTINNSDSFDQQPTIPLPTGVIGGRWNLSQKWQSLFKYEFFLLEFGDYKGSQQDFQLLLEHRTFKHIGFGAGINTIYINMRAKSDSLRGEFDSRMLGLLAYANFYF